MDNAMKSIDQLLAEGSLSYPQKESSKEKPTEQQPIAHRSTGYSTKGRVSQPSSPQLTEVEPQEQTTKPKQSSLDDSPLAKAERRSRALRSLEIDDYVLQLVNEGLVNEDYFQRAAKICTLLGLQHVNRLVLQVRAATCDPNKGQSKQKLLTWKMNGALNLHYKKQFYHGDSAGNDDQLNLTH